FLRKVLGFYESFTGQLGDSAEARFLRARGHFKVARLHATLGERAQAEAGYRRAAALLGGLAADFPAKAVYREKLATSHTSLGVLLGEQRNYAEAETECRAAVALQARLASDFPDVALYRQQWASGCDVLLKVLAKQTKYGEAEKACSQA